MGRSDDGAAGARRHRGSRRCAEMAVAVVVLVTVSSAPAVAVDPEARLCRAYSGLPKGFGPSAGTDRPPGMAFVEGGRFRMGSDAHYPEERPIRSVTVGSFWIDRHEVTNAQFAAFVAATGYRTTAETGFDPKDLPGLPPEAAAPGSMVFRQPDRPAGTSETDWWVYVPGASWRAPEGPGSSIDGRGNEPVVQVSWRDAKAYAAWLGRDLPTEAEWEFAARGGLEDAPYAWGVEVRPGGRYMANSWQGLFPVLDEGSDGFKGRAPVGCFQANGLGLFDVTGNVWEMTLDLWAAGHRAEPPVLPVGLSQPDGGPLQPRVIKGGSYLCSTNYCGRYRPASRQPQETGLGASHVGFRTVLRVPGPAPDVAAPASRP